MATWLKSSRGYNDPQERSGRRFAAIGSDYMQRTFLRYVAATKSGHIGDKSPLPARMP